MATAILHDPSLDYTFPKDPPTTLDRLSSQAKQWPLSLADSLSWDGKAYAQSETYTYHLTNDDKSEISRALTHFAGTSSSLELDGSQVVRANFPLPTLGRKLSELAAEVHRGRGFVNIRGLCAGDYSAEDNVVLFLGLSSYIGEKRGRQNEEGEMLTHIRHDKVSREAEDDRPTRYSKRASAFHTDAFCDMLALQTRSLAAVGGRHLIASSYHICNKMAALRPDLLEVLAKPDWTFDGGHFMDSTPRPLLFYHSCRIILNFSLEPLLGIDSVAPRADALPALTPKQKEALDLVETLAQESQLVLELQPGDLTFINNFSVLHAREAYEDHNNDDDDEEEEGGHIRYLVRLWLQNPGLRWKLPGALQVGNGRLYGENGMERKWNVKYKPKVQFKISDRLPT